VCEPLRCVDGLHVGTKGFGWKLKRFSFGTEYMRMNRRSELAAKQGSQETHLLKRSCSVTE
jgi:hypothetical protein